MKKDLSAEVQIFKEKYSLTESAFDAECIYQPGVLSDLLSTSLNALLPDMELSIDEHIEEGRYAATILHQGATVVKLYADADADWLPDDFWELFDSIPARLGIEKQFCSINPRLTGQLVWYLCGTRHIKGAKEAGLPIVLYGEDIFDMELSDYE
jgi:hypothetical protein